MLGDAFEARKAADSVGFAGERPDNSPGDGALRCVPGLRSIPEHSESVLRNGYCENQKSFGNPKGNPLETYWKSVGNPRGNP